MSEKNLDLVFFRNIGLGNIIYREQRIQVNIQSACRLSPVINHFVLQWNKSHHIRDTIEIEFPKTDQSFSIDDVKSFFQIINGDQNIIKLDRIKVFTQISDALEINSKLLFDTKETVPIKDQKLMLEIQKKIRMTNQSDETIERMFIKTSILTSAEFITQNFNDIWPIYRRAYQEKAIPNNMMCPIMHGLINEHRWMARNLVDALLIDNGFTEQEINGIVLHLLQCIGMGSISREIINLKELLQQKGGNSHKCEELLDKIYKLCVKENEELKKNIAKLNSELLELEKLRKKLAEIENNPQYIILKMFVIRNQYGAVNKKYKEMKKKKELTEDERKEYEKLKDRLREPNREINELKEKLKGSHFDKITQKLDLILGTKPSDLQKENEMLRRENEMLRRENEELKNGNLNSTMSDDKSKEADYSPQKKFRDKRRGKSSDTDLSNRIHELNERIKFLEEENALLKTAVNISDSTLKDVIDAESLQMLKVFIHCNKEKCTETKINGVPAIIYAISRKKHKIIPAMINNGFDPNVCDNNGNNIIYYVIDSPKKITEYHNAGVSVTNINNEGKSLLHIVENPDSVLTLIDLGVDVDLADNNGDTPLIEALQRYLPEIALRLKEKNSDLKAKTKNNENILHLSTKSTKLQPFFTEVFHLVADQINEQDSDGNTPLHNALRNDLDKAAESLIKKGADLEVQNKDGETSLTLSLRSHNKKINKCARHIAKKIKDSSYTTKSGDTPLSIAIDNPDVSEETCKHILNKDKRKNHKGLMLKTINNKKFKITKAMIDNEWEMDSIDEDGNGIVLRLVGDSSEGAGATLDYAIEHGADINKRNKKGVTPIRKAVDTKDIKSLEKIINNESFDPSSMIGDSNIIIEAMKKKLPDKNIFDIINQSPDSVRNNEALKNSLPFRREDISTAILRDDTDLSGIDILNDTIVAGFEGLSCIELDHGASPFYDLDGLSSIFHVADRGWTLHTKKIIDLYPEKIMEEKDKNKDNIFIHSLKNGQFDIMDYLISHNPSLVNEKNEDGDTPLIISTLCNQIEAIHKLLEKGADASVANIKGLTPLHIAIMIKNIQAIKLLLDYLKKHDESKLKEVVNKKAGDVTPLKLSISEFPDVAVDLLNYGAECQDNDELEEETPLMLAFKNDVDEDVIKALIKNSDVNKQDKDGNNAAMIAVKNEDYKGYITLVTEKEDELDMSTQNKESQLITHILADHNPTIEAIDITNSSWTQADSKGRIPIIEMMKNSPELFAAALRKIDYKTFCNLRFGKLRNTIIHEAIRTNKVHLLPAFKDILKDEKNPDMNLFMVENADGMTAIHYACMIDNADAVNELCKLNKNCINEEREVVEELKKKRTYIPQHTAALYGSSKAMTALIRNGINIDTPSCVNSINKPKTALMLAIEQRSIGQLWEPPVSFIKYLMANKACARSIEITRKNGLKTKLINSNEPKTTPANKSGIFSKASFVKPKETGSSLRQVQTDPEFVVDKVSFVEDEFEKCLNYVTEVSKDAEVMWILLEAFADNRPVFNLLVESNNEALISLVMVTKKSELAKADSNGKTPLMRAVELNNIVIAKKLLANKFGINIINKKNGYSAPFYATTPEMLMFLIETDTIDYGIKVDGVGLLEHVIRTFDLKDSKTANVFELMVSKTEAFSDGYASNGRSILQIAYEHVMCEEVCNWINYHFMKNISMIDNDGRTVFHSVVKSWPKGVEQLLMNKPQKRQSKESTLESIDDSDLLCKKDKSEKTALEQTIEIYENNHTFENIEKNSVMLNGLKETIKLFVKYGSPVPQALSFEMANLINEGKK